MCVNLETTYCGCLHTVTTPEVCQKRRMEMATKYGLVHGPPKKKNWLKKLFSRRTCWQGTMQTTRLGRCDTCIGEAQIARSQELARERVQREEAKIRQRQAEYDEKQRAQEEYDDKMRTQARMKAQAQAVADAYDRQVANEAKQKTAQEEYEKKRRERESKDADGQRIANTFARLNAADEAKLKASQAAAGFDQDDDKRTTRVYGHLWSEPGHHGEHRKAESPRQAIPSGARVRFGSPSERHERPLFPWESKESSSGLPSTVAPEKSAVQYDRDELFFNVPTTAPARRRPQPPPSSQQVPTLLAPPAGRRRRPEPPAPSPRRHQEDLERMLGRSLTNATRNMTPEIQQAPLHQTQTIERQVHPAQSFRVELAGPERDDISVSPVSPVTPIHSSQIQSPSKDWTHVASATIVRSKYTWTPYPN